MTYIDVHCHINERDYGDVNALISSIFGGQIAKIITVGYDLPSSEYGKSLAEKYDGVYFTAGFQPTEVKKYKDGDLYKIEELAKHKKCVAIGEIGLDYHYPDTDEALQKYLFGAQIELANSLKMPVQIHSRDCAEDMLNILKQNKQKLEYGAMLHCYSHSPEMAREFEKLGLYFSFGGMSTYKNSKRAKKSIMAISSFRLLSETDSHYLPPSSKCGVFPNTPLSIPEITENMAQLKGVSPQEMASCIWQNAHQFFKKLN